MQKKLHTKLITRTTYVNHSLLCNAVFHKPNLELGLLLYQRQSDLAVHLIWHIFI